MTGVDGSPAGRLLTLRVTDIRGEADGIRFFELRDPGGAELPRFEAGAHLRVTVELPDGDVVYHDAKRNLEVIETTVRSILLRGVLPVVIGGDHSISYPVIRAFDRMAPLTIVLGAHLDYKDEVCGLKLTNSSPFPRAQELAFVQRIITIGVRGVKSTDRELRESSSTACPRRWAITTSV
jgi:arginase family enzyme